MFELKNFYVKENGRIIIEDVNFRFITSQKYLIQCESGTEKDAFIGGLLGFSEFFTFGKIIWECKWRLHLHETYKRMKDHFFWFTENVPKFENITLRNYLSILENENKHKNLDLLINEFELPKNTLDNNLYNNFTQCEILKFQLLEFYFLTPRVAIIDLPHANSYFWHKLNASPRNFTALIFTKLENLNVEPIKIDKYLVLQRGRLKNK